MPLVTFKDYLKNADNITVGMNVIPLILSMRSVRSYR